MFTTGIISICLSVFTLFKFTKHSKLVLVTCLIHLIFIFSVYLHLKDVDEKIGVDDEWRMYIRPTAYK